MPILFFLISILISTTAFSGPTDTAISIDDQVKSYAGSSKKLNENLLNPLVSPNKMKTFDGTEFEAQITCEGEKETLGMVVIPGATGDISNLIISQDTTDSGTFDSVITLPFAVSGICSNGVMSCDAGEWTGCKSYKWGVDGLGKMELNQVGINDLGGCYCINNHCGTNLVSSNMTNILGDMMSGAMATMVQASQKYTPSRIKIDGNAGTYFTQKMIDCSSPKVTEAKYFDTPAIISAAAFTSSSTDDTFDLIVNSDAAAESETTIKACSAKRNISLTLDYIDVPSCTPGTWTDITTTARTFDKYGDDAWLETQVFCDPGGPLQIRIRAWDGSGSGTCNAKMGADSQGFVALTMPLTDKITNGYVLTNPNLRGSACYDVPVFYNGSCVSSDGGCTYTFEFFNGTAYSIDPLGTDAYSYQKYPQNCATLIADPSGEVTSTNCINTPDGGSSLYENKMSITTLFTRPHITPTPDISSCRIDIEGVNNTCLSYEGDPECSLLNETVDTIQTIQSYQPTGISPLPGTVSIEDGLCTLNITRDFWDKERDYRCKTNLSYNYDDIIMRAGTIMTTTDSSTGNYADKTLNGGSWTGSAGSIAKIGDFIDPDSCTQVCKTKREIKNADSGTFGVTSDLRVNDITYEYEYKECKNNTCSLETGESLVTGCGCLSQFGEAAATIQAVRLGARDLICTSGTPQQP